MSQSENKSNQAPLIPIARGFSNGDIARLLDISVATVRTHRQRMMDKLELRNAAEITAYAVRMGWYDVS